VTELAHWDCRGSHGELEHVNKPVPNSTPEAAMDDYSSKARFVFGDQDWSAWTWKAREYGVRTPRVLRFRRTTDEPPTANRASSRPQRGGCQAEASP